MLPFYSKPNGYLKSIEYRIWVKLWDGQESFWSFQLRHGWKIQLFS